MEEPGRSVSRASRWTASGRGLRQLPSRNLWCAAAAVVAAVASLLLRARAPVWVDDSAYDSLLFTRNAAAVAHGHWLGTFGVTTLAKGPGYPIFLATIHKVGLSLPIAAQLTVLAAAAAVALCLWVLLRNPLLSTGAFVLLVLDPANFGSDATYVGRDDWYASTCVLGLATLFLTAYLALRTTRVIPTVAGAVIAGFSLATAALTREEGAWLAPAALVLAGGLPAASAVRWFLRSASREPRSWPWRRLVRVAVAGALVLLAAVVPLRAVAAANRNHYGVSLTNDMSTGQFARAYADWTRVRAGRLLPRVPLSQSQRMAVYPISAAARELQPVLENPHNGFAGMSCAPAGIGPDCDISGAFMVWLLREAAARAGHFGSGAEVQRFFGQLDREIDDGCRTKAIQCARQLPVALQPLQRTTLLDVVARSTRSARSMLTNPGFTTLQSRTEVLTDRQRSQIATVLGDYPATTAQADARQLSFDRHNTIYRALAAVYRPLLVCLLALSLLGWIAALFRRRRTDAPTLVLAVGLAVAVLSRAAVLGILDATAYPSADNSRYQMAGRDCLIFLILVGLAVLARRPRPANPPSGPAAVPNPSSTELVLS